MRTTSVQDQVQSAFVNDINIRRAANELKNLNMQDFSFNEASKHINAVRDFIGSPEKILGNSNTKHGEIAEQVEVGVRNARDVLEGKFAKATFDNVGRLAPEDYVIDGVAVQSKFINGTNNGLSHVMNHMEKYSQFGRDGSYYHIPKDQYEIIDNIRQGKNLEGLNAKSVQAIKDKIAEIEAKSGQPFDKVVRPGISDYAEVQQGKITQTLDKHQESLEKRNEEIKDKIRKDHQASLNEGLKAAGTAAAVGAAISLGSSLYSKYKNENKNIFNGDFNNDDWQELGLSALKGGVIGAVTGASVYALTNCAGLSAPLAGAFVTATKGVKQLVQDYYNGLITFDEFQVNSIFLCADSAGVGLATVAGQTLIPIPVVGSVVGALAGKIVCKVLFEEDKKLAQKMKDSMSKVISKADHAYDVVVKKINAEFDKISSLRELAFDVNSNVSIVESSIALARAHNVLEHKILKNEEDLRSFLFD